jgi:8-oxo-dGTP pyrophosphatase MutT (NUDIX family)
VKIPSTFDPRAIPVHRVDNHLPSLTTAHWEIAEIERKFSQRVAWTPDFVSEPRFSDRPLAQAAVLVALVMRKDISVLLTQRTAHLSSHSGQIAFPGGKVDSSDAGVIEAALREAHEEVGLESRFTRVLGVMPTYTTGSGYIVSPVIATVSEGFSLKASADEVDDVFEVPLEFLMNPAHHRHHVVDWGGSRREWLSMPYSDATGERFIWGATAGMLRNLYQFLKA